MIDPPPHPDGPDPATERPTDGFPDEHPARECRFTLVQYEDRADECTICPRDLGPDDILTTWITAERDVVRDLANCR